MCCSMMLMLPGILRSLLECCSELQHVAAWFSALQRCVETVDASGNAACYRLLHVLQRVAVCWSMLHCGYETVDASGNAA